MSEKKRKIVQIAFEVRGDIDSTDSQLHALCDDGSVWYLVERVDGNNRWERWSLPEIPPEPKP